MWRWRALLIHDVNETDNVRLQYVMNHSTECRVLCRFKLNMQRLKQTLSYRQITYHGLYVAVAHRSWFIGNFFLYEPKQNCMKKVNFSTTDLAKGRKRRCRCDHTFSESQWHFQKLLMVPCTVWMWEITGYNRMALLSLPRAVQSSEGANIWGASDTACVT